MFNRRWREECFRLMVEAERVKLQGEADEARRASQTSEAVGRLAAETRRREVAEEKAKALAAKLRLVEEEGRRSEVARREAEERVARLTEGLREEREACRGMAAAVVDFKAGMEEARRESEAGVLGAMALLGEYEGRLGMLQGRVELLATLLVQNELQVRNTMAALEADRRAWLAGAKRGQAAQPSFAAPGRGRAGGMPILGLRPECEAMMRAVFRRLDSNGRGMVDGRRLVEVLGRDSGVAKMMERWVGARVWAQALRCLEAKVASLPEEGATLTWGEFLLFFLPDPEEEDGQQGGTSAFVRQKGARGWGAAVGSMSQQLQGKAQVELEEEEEALLCLVVPEGWADTSVQLREGTLAPDQMRRELRRLGKERTFLLKLVRQGAEQLMDRAERIRLRYVDEIVGLQRRVEELGEETGALREQAEGARREAEREADRAREVEVRTEER
jgi:hypothetical protein